MQALIQPHTQNVQPCSTPHAIDRDLLRILGPQEIHATRDIVIRPEIALDMVTRLNYEHQRKLSERNVSDLEFAITKGKFREFSDIHFVLLNGQLHLVNGQHTLRAIARTVAQRLCVHVYRVPDAEALHAMYCTFDINRRRSLRDSLNAVRDEICLNKNQIDALGAAVKRIHVAFADAWHGSSRRPKEFYENGDYMDVIARMLDWSVEARAYFALIDAAPKDNRTGFVTADVVAVGLITMRAHSARAVEFWGQAALDDGLRNSDPRKKLLNWLRTHPTSETKRTDHHRAAIACWNAHFAGRTLEKVHTDAQSSKSISGCDFTCKA